MKSLYFRFWVLLNKQENILTDISQGNVPVLFNSRKEAREFLKGFKESHPDPVAKWKGLTPVQIEFFKVGSSK